MLGTELTFDVQFALIVARLKGTEMDFDRYVLLGFDQVFGFVQLKGNNLMMLVRCRARIGDQIPLVDANRQLDAMDMVARSVYVPSVFYRDID